MGLDLDFGMSRKLLNCLNKRLTPEAIEEIKTAIQENLDHDLELIDGDLRMLSCEVVEVVQGEDRELIVTLRERS